MSSTLTQLRGTMSNKAVISRTNSTMSSFYELSNREWGHRFVGGMHRGTEGTCSAYELVGTRSLTLEAIRLAMSMAAQENAKVLWMCTYSDEAVEAAEYLGFTVVRLGPGRDAEEDEDEEELDDADGIHDLMYCFIPVKDIPREL